MLTPLIKISVIREGNSKKFVRKHDPMNWHFQIVKMSKNLKEDILNWKCWVRCSALQNHCLFSQGQASRHKENFEIAVQSCQNLRFSSILLVLQVLNVRKWGVITACSNTQWKHQKPGNVWRVWNTCKET